MYLLKIFHVMATNISEKMKDNPPILYCITVEIKGIVHDVSLRVQLILFNMWIQFLLNTLGPKMEFRWQYFLLRLYSFWKISRL